MTPTQRTAAERLVEGPRTSGVLWGRAVIALLRELLAEPVQEPTLWYRTFGAGPMLCAADHPDARPLYAARAALKETP